MLGWVHLLTLRLNPLRMCLGLHFKKTQANKMHFVLAQFKWRTQTQVTVLWTGTRISHWIGAQSRYGHPTAYLKYCVSLIFLFSHEKRKRHCPLSRCFVKPYLIDLNQAQWVSVHYAIAIFGFLYAKLVYRGLAVYFLCV